MSEMTSSASWQSRMRPEVARRRIASFGKRFGQAHLYLAYHAAFPLALTPDLLYRLWANFPRDIDGKQLNIPWVAVADLLLSSLCEEVGLELYEMNVTVRNELLSDLKANPSFNAQRMTELANFLLTYIDQRLNSLDLSISDFARTQQWTALAYVNPSKAANSLADTLSKFDWNNRAEQMRIVSLVEIFAEQQKGFTPLLMYVKGMAHFARGEMEKAWLLFNNAVEEEQGGQVREIRLRVPIQVLKKIEEVKSHTLNFPEDRVEVSLRTPQEESSRSEVTAHNLRYHAEQSYPNLYTYLQQRAKRYLGSLKYNALELDIVVEHVIEQLVRLGVLGGGDVKPETALDRLSKAQFYTFLNHSVRNKAIDRLRKHRLPIDSIAELEVTGDMVEEENHPLDEATETIWGTGTFVIPEEAAVGFASQQELRNQLKHSIKALSSAPRQLQAVIQELEELGAVELLRALREELSEINLTTDDPLPITGQDRDLAHKKLRHSLQQSSTNLAIKIALRLSQDSVDSTALDEVLVDIQTLVQDDLSEREVQTGLIKLVSEGLLDWHGEEVVRLTKEQKKRLARFYAEE